MRVDGAAGQAGGEDNDGEGELGEAGEAIVGMAQLVD